MKKSFVDSNKTVSPFKSPDQDAQNRSFEFNKARYTEVTIQTFDKDVPFIAIYKPDVSVERRRVQAATKLVSSLLNLQKVRVIYAMNKVVGLGPKQKALKMKTLYLGCLFEKMVNIRKEKVMKGLVVNKIKKNNALLSAKIVCKIQNSILNRNYKGALTELRRNRLLGIVKELSDNNEMATQLKRHRQEIAKRKDESFSQGFIDKCRKLQKNTNREAFMQLLVQQNFVIQTKKEIKKFEEIRYNGYPKRKETLENQSVAIALSNIIQNYQGSLKEYENYCEQLQSQLATYKDTEGIQQLKQTIAQKDNAIRDFQAFVNELGRMDIELKKFTVENKFLTDRLASTLNTQDKKLEQKAKTLQGTNVKVLSSRTYLTGVISILLKKYEQTQKELKEFESRDNENQLAKNTQIQNLEKEIASMKTQIEQEKARLLAFFEKRENRNGLLDLKRKWKSNDELKSLVDYVAILHEQIQKLSNQNGESLRTIEKMKVQQTKRIERQRSSKEESKVLELSKKMQQQQSEARRIERQFHNKSKSLQKQKLDLTRKLQKEQSDISRIKKELENKTRELELQRQESSRKEKDLHNSVAKITQYIKKTVDYTNQPSITITSSIANDITEPLGPIVTPVQQLVDLVCRLKNENHSAEKRSIYEQSFVESDVKVYKPEINIDEFQKQIAHRLFSHLQTELQAKQSEIAKNRKIDTKNEDQLTITLSDLKYKMELLDKKLTRSNTDQLVSKSINKITELQNTIKQLEKAIIELSSHNETLILKIQQLKTYYQQQIDIMNNQFRQTVSFIGNQYSQKIVGFTSHQSSNARLISQKNEQIFSKQLQIHQEINSLRSQLMCMLSQNNYRNIQTVRPNEDSNILRLKITEFQSELSRRTHQKERAQNRLKQTEQSLENQRQKISSLQADLVRMQQQLDRSHSQTDKLAMQTHDEVKKITMVLRALQEELDKKTRLAQNYQNKSSNQEKTIIKLESQLHNIQQQLQESIRHCSMLQQKNMELNGELNHLKTEFFSIQVELQSNRNNKNFTSSQVSSLQNQIRQKQSAINSILQQSRANSTSLNQQLFEAREHLVNQERKFEEQLTVKSALINRLEHQLIEYQSTIRTLQQKSKILQQNSKRAQQESKHEGYDIKDKQIELLRQQIASLQQFLADISHQYKQLQIKYHQQKLKFGGSPIQKLHNHQLQHSMEVIDKAIHQLSDNAPFSQEVKSLIYNNERLQISIEELQEEKFKLLEKTKKLPEREYVVQLVFNVLLGARGVSANSSKGTELWNHLLKINQECGEVGDLFCQLQKFTVGQLSNKK